MFGNEKNLKVLFITNDDNIYGANRALLSLIKELQKRNCVCEVLLSKNGVIADELDRLSIKHYTYKTCTWMCSKSDKKWKNLIRVMYNKAVFWLIARRLKTENYDVVHTNSSVTNLGAYLSRKWKCKHVWHIREIPESYHLTYIYPDTYVKKQYVSADKVIAISDYVAGYYKNRFDCEIKLETIYDGVTTTEPKHEEHKLFSFCIVGIISENKGQLNVCKSIKNLVDRNINNFVCYIVGGVGEKDYYKKICDYISYNHLEKNILVVGHTLTPITYYKQSDVGIMASQSEGFGLVTVEYMMNELPVLGANAGATSELICDGENGFLFEKDDCNDLADKMMWCIQNQDQVKKMGKGSRQFALGHFSAEKNANEVFRVYNKLFVEKTRNCIGQTMM